MITLAKWSIQDYHQMISAGILSNRHVELLEGEIIEMSPEKSLHRKITDSIAEYLREKFRGLAKIYEAHPVTLPNSEPEPDIAVVKMPAYLYDTRHPYSEEIYLLIEVSDTTLEKNLEKKRFVYARAGILEYWVVDVVNEQLIVFQEPSKDDYQVQKNYSQGTIFTLVFPELEILVEKLLK
ncbi:MAG: Uma2 family endonuclease [Okeania sp. SIO2C2]|uniref:Uma2 family endonuclease n=1 Tax=Okeania sp. SIO2C2 TaxID=2607787 RepID=UPI0013B78575|nr:Uma2 family endonuclease [Okeania sp. SIO2C2]NEP85942.1 Uma2 family endonuclease [Okeania sp. SIO2C2]